LDDVVREDETLRPRDGAVPADFAERKTGEGSAVVEVQRLASDRALHRRVGLDRAPELEK
jgi:hypothetical protein